MLHHNVNTTCLLVCVGSLVVVARNVLVVRPLETPSTSNPVDNMQQDLRQLRKVNKDTVDTMVYVGTS